MNFMAQTMVIDIEDESMRDAIKDIVVDITHQLEPDVVVKEVASPVKAKTTSKTMELFFEGPPLADTFTGWITCRKTSRSR